MKFNLWTGAAWQDWAPNDIKEKGLGGSETAVVMMARELVKLGHEVTVYGQFPLDMDAVQDGARYVHYKYVTDPGQISGDVFVSSRDVHALMMQPKSKATAVWVHDINLGHDTFDRLDKYDTILCLSKWSAKAIEAYYPHVRRTKILVTRNGIDVSRFKPDVDADEILKQKPWPPHFVYASSPDRGLDKLLDFWPSIREMAPGTELHVYYGFDIWKLMAKGNPQALNQIAWFEDRLMRMKKHGVTFHGKVNQKTLAEAYLRSLLWLYPTAFKETSCISAMEAQAAGAVPICTKLAALGETVAEGVFIEPHNVETRYEREFLAAVKDLLVDNPGKRIALARQGRRLALDNLGWEGVARQWVEHFGKVIADKESRK